MWYSVNRLSQNDLWFFNGRARQHSLAIIGQNVTEAGAVRGAVAPTQGVAPVRQRSSGGAAPRRAM